MPHSSDSSDSSFSRSPPPGKQDSSDDVRKVQRREKNRIAAQKSRQRQTQKADTLHLCDFTFCPADMSHGLHRKLMDCRHYDWMFGRFQGKLWQQHTVATIKQRGDFPECSQASGSLLLSHPQLLTEVVSDDPQESEDLEKQNAALRKEIKQLTEELKYFTSVLSSHEPLCSVLASGTPSPPEVVYSAHAFHQPHISSPRFQP